MLGVLVDKLLKDLSRLGAVRSKKSSCVASEALVPAPAVSVAAR